MKKLLLSVFAFCLLPFAFCQVSIEVSEGNKNIGGGSNNALSVTIYEAGKSEIEKAWKSEMKGIKGKVAMKKEIFADDAQFKGWSNTCDIYAQVNKLEDTKHELIVSVDLGGAYLSSGQHAGKFKEFKQFVYGFAVSTTKDAIAGQVKEEEKKQKGIEKELEELVKNKEKLDKLIEESKAKIEQAEKDIEQNGKDQEAKTKEIEDQKKVVEETVAKEQAVK
ncbi:MAG: hypothetical protein COA57_16565 [Flavobacteriales bacterium]|nr:MAG: hypothetical protein COA57_16565 [Flavobacteriales bacterium]